MAKLSWIVVLLATVPWGLVLAQSAAALRERQEDLEATLTTIPLELTVGMRRTCAAGDAPANTTMSRTSGFNSPDASDTCSMSLLRLAREGMLLNLYRDLMVSATGQTAGHEKIPAAVAAAAMRGGAEVSLGNQRAVAVSTSLAFDAGFTVAYQQRQAMTSSMPALQVLKPIAERCLAGQERDRGLCYATGLTYGARAVSGQPVAQP